MDVNRCSKAVTGTMLLMIMALTLPVEAQEDKPGEKTVLAGPIGKSSSASARITLVIPPRPDKQQSKAEPEPQAKQIQDSASHNKTQQ